MRKTNSLLFVPSNATFLSGEPIINKGALTEKLNKKIRENPGLREVYRMQAKQEWGYGEDAPKKEESSAVASFSGAQKSGEQLDYIKNLTDGPIILDFGEGVKLEKGERPPPCKILKHFIAKSDIKEHLDSPVLEGLYSKNLIEDIPKSQMQTERKEIEVSEEAEQKRIEDAEKGRTKEKTEGGEIRKYGGVTVEEFSSVREAMSGEPMEDAPVAISVEGEDETSSLPQSNPVQIQADSGQFNTLIKQALAEGADEKVQVPENADISSLDFPDTDYKP